MPDLGKNFMGSLQDLADIHRAFADKHLGRTEPVTVDWNTSYKG